MDPARSSLLTELLIIVVLTLINAFFAAAEIAFVSINKSKVNQLANKGDKKAVRVLSLLDDADDFLATIQVAITFAGFLSSAQAATSFAVDFAQFLPDFSGASTVATIIVTLILSYFTLVFGELFPKQIALQMPEKVALGTSGPVTFVKGLFHPFIKLLSASTNLLQKITPIDFAKAEEKFTREEMRVIIEQSRESDSFDIDELDMMEGVLSLDTKIAREVMVPRTDSVMIDIEDDYQENITTIIESPFSRIPIYKGDKDNVIAVLHVKNLLKAASEKGFDNIDLMEISNPPLVVPSTMYTDDLLIEYQRQQQHMAILIDEYGGVEGIVTMEDLLEEIVGEIDDESDISSAGDVRMIDEFNYYINGSISIEAFNKFFDEDIEADEVDTIAGFLIYHIGYVPSDDERVSLRINKKVLTASDIQNGRIYGILLNYDDERKIEADYIVHEYEPEEDKRDSKSPDKNKSDDN